MRRLYVFSFFTALVLAACAPDPGQRIVSVSPPPGSTDVAVDTSVQATFRGSVDPESAREGFTLATATGEQVEGTVSVDPERRVVTFTPVAYLSYDTQYVATVASEIGVKGRRNVPNREDYVWSFTTRPDPVVEVAVTSHEPGQSVFGPRLVTLSGTLTSGSAVTDVTVRHNGVELPGVSFDQDSFEVEFELADNDANSIEVLAVNESGREGTVTLGLVYPFTRLVTHQEAAVALGKYNSAYQYWIAGYGAQQFSGPLRGNPATHDGMLYLPDRGNNRATIHYNIPQADGEPADSVLGQADFSGNGPAAGSSGLAGPGSVVTAQGMLFIADRDNNRVLIWNSVPLGPAPADVVLGQIDFDGTGEGCGPGSLRSPESLFVVDGRLFVADTGNHRVLVWNGIPVANGQPADLVVGQDDFTSCSANAGTGGAGSGTLSYPGDVWSDGERLVVADTGNNRVLIWSSPPAGGVAPAQTVVGQPDFSSTVASTGGSGLNGPVAVDSNGNQLFVADRYNNRVLAWDLIPTSNGAPADVVLGQGNFECGIENSYSTAAGDCNYAFYYGLDIDGTMLYQPGGIELTPERLLVADGYNHRYLLFEAVAGP